MPIRTPKVVIDTNVVLDMLLFAGKDTRALHQALLAGDVQWCSTQAMCDEFEAVLAYPWIVEALDQRGLTVSALQQSYDTLSHTCEAAPYTPPRCRDADDQKFIDLAAAQHAELLSRDKDLLKLRRKLSKQGIVLRSTWHQASDDTIGIT